MKKQFILIGFLSFLLVSLSASSPAHEKSEKSAKELSAKDKEVVIEIFKTIDAGLYRFQFSKEESFGTKIVFGPFSVKMREGKKVNFVNAISETYFPTMNFWYVVDNPKPPGEGLEGVFGKANAARLQAIIHKYTGGK